MASGTTTYASLPSGVFIRKLKGIFLTEAAKIDDYIPKMYNVTQTNLIQNMYQGFAGLGPANQWDMESSINFDTIASRYETTVTQIAFRKGVKITWKVKTYDKQFNLAQKEVASLAKSLAQSKQIYAFSFMNNQLAGTGTKWNTTENKYLFATDHPMANGSTFQNTVTGALSVTTLQEAIWRLEATPDDNGVVMGLKAQNLWVNPYNYINAVEVVNKGIGLRSDVQYNTKNAFDEFGLNIISCQWLTDTDAWILQADEHNAVCESSVGYEQSQWVENTSRSTIHEAIFAIQVGATDWRGFVGSTGA